MSHRKLIRNAAGILSAFLSVQITTRAQAPLSPQQQASANADFARTHYTKQELHIPMRDGTKLYTAVYTPINAQFPDHGPYPFLMTRTPYSCAPYGPDKIAPHITSNPNLLHSGYILVCQDVRGRWDSEGIISDPSSVYSDSSFT